MEGLLGLLGNISSKEIRNPDPVEPVESESDFIKRVNKMFGRNATNMREAMIGLTEEQIMFLMFSQLIPGTKIHTKEEEDLSKKADNLLESEKVKSMDMMLKPILSSEELKSRSHRLLDPLDKLLFLEIIKKEISNFVYLKDSKIHGKGVFAAKDIKKGQDITIYPPHYVITYPKRIWECKPNSLCHIMTSDFAEKIAIDEHVRNNYSFLINDQIKIVGSPEITDKSCFLGHMINDGAKSHSTKSNYNEKDHDIYIRISLLKRNVVFNIKNDNIVFITAIKDIAKDEEILITYNYNYWVSVNTI